jgi:Mn2+/Fe2+ NRAMP family transporter
MRCMNRTTNDELPAQLADLKPPSFGLLSLIRHFGPGLMLMMTGIGTSHLITAPTAGGRFAFALLWCLPIAYVFKYYGFEMAFRFTGATGRSLLDAYSTSWRKWTLWYIMLTTLAQCAIGQAGRVVAAAAVLYFLFSEQLNLGVPLWGWGLLLSCLSCAIILFGRYKAVEIATKIFAGILVVSAVATYVFRPAPLASLGHFFLVEVPEGSWLLIAAFFGLLPTGIDVSLQASEWGKARRTGLGGIRTTLEKTGVAKSFDPFSPRKEDLAVDVTTLPRSIQQYVYRWFRISIWDFRVGHVVSFFMAAIFLLLSAMWLYPSAVEGKAIIGEIAQIFTLSVGPWMMTIFLLGAFAATFSTMFNYFDGWPRVVAACCRNLFKRTSELQGIDRGELAEKHRKTWYSEYNIYRATMLFSLLTAVLIIAGFEKPVWLVLVSSAAALFVAPIIYGMNLYYCMTIIPKHDKVLYPSRFARYFGWGSLVVFSGLTAVLILARVFNLTLM